MDVDELAELEDPDTWEEHGEILPPAEAPRAVLAVRLTIDDLELLEGSAR